METDPLALPRVVLYIRDIPTSTGGCRRVLIRSRIGRYIKFNASGIALVTIV
jgi:hypothetical protein